MDLPEIPESLRRLSPLLHEFAAPCVSFSLKTKNGSDSLKSKLGGQPDLPVDFEWPTRGGNPIDFLMQVNLAEAAPLDCTGSLPRTGLLSFFYDLKEQPWGFDPKELDGFRVCYTPTDRALKSQIVPRPNVALDEKALDFRSGLSLPHIGSRIYQQFDAIARLSDEEFDDYLEYCSTVELLQREDANHHLLGHSANVQGDMQLEAELVSNGLYCGKAGYEDPRAGLLEPHAEDWILLLQLDSDEKAGFMWGDLGMLYIWIRKQDLLAGEFDRVWMGLQCG